MKARRFSLRKWASDLLSNFLLLASVSGALYALSLSTLSIGGSYPPKEGFYSAFLIFLVLLLAIRISTDCSGIEVVAGSLGAASFWLGVYLWYLGYADESGYKLYPAPLCFGLLFLLLFSYEPLLLREDIEKLQKLRWRRR